MSAACQHDRICNHDRKGRLHRAVDLPEYLFRKGVPVVLPIRGGKRTHHQEKLDVTLRRFKGNRTQSAQHLGISRVTLWKLIKEFGIAG